MNLNSNCDNNAAVQQAAVINEANPKRDADIKRLNEDIERKWNKDRTQAEIMSYFIQNPDENILISMIISKDTEDGCEIIDFWDAKHENDELNKLLDWVLWQVVWWVKIKADETWEKWEQFSKELAIDRKSNTRWILLVWKKWFKIDEVDFEDISQYKTPYEAYFAYKKDWKTYIKTIKNEYIKTKFIIKDVNLSWKMDFSVDMLDWMTREMLESQKKELMKLLKEAKENWTLHESIEELLAQIQIPDDAKSIFKEQLYALSEV